MNRLLLLTLLLVACKQKPCRATPYYYSKACGIYLYKIPLVIDPIFVFGKSRYIKGYKARHIRFYDLSGIFLLVNSIILIDDIALHIGRLYFSKERHKESVR